MKNKTKIPIALLAILSVLLVVPIASDVYGFHGHFPFWTMDDDFEPTEQFMQAQGIADCEYGKLYYAAGLAFPHYNNTIAVAYDFPRTNYVHTSNGCEKAFSLFANSTLTQNIGEEPDVEQVECILSHIPTHKRVYYAKCPDLDFSKDKTFEITTQATYHVFDRNSTEFMIDQKVDWGTVKVKVQ